MADAEAIKYRAFLSYSHRDKALGEWLHRALERYSIDKALVGRKTLAGPVPKSLRPIFRDREDFSAGHSLTEQTIAALEASQFLVVVCSPNAARSKYVNEEIRRFKTFGRGHRVIPVIIDGEPGDPERECFPPALRFKIAADGTLTDEREEPIAADVRPAGDGKDVAKLKVIAGLLGLSLDEIVRREERARHRRLRNWVAALAVITAGFAGLAGWAEFSRSSAEKNRLLAEQRQQEAERNFVVAKESIDTLVYDIADGLREVEGMSTTALRRILERAEASVERLVKAGNNDLGLLETRAAMLTYFSDIYGKHGDLIKQRSSIQAALDIFSFLSQARPNDAKFKAILSEVQVKLGDLFVVRGHLKEAGETFRDRRAFLEKLLITDPSNLDRQTDLALTIQRIGNVLIAQGRLEAALTAYQEYVALTGRLAESQPTQPVFQLNLASAYEKMGNVEFMRMNLEESEAFHRKALSIREISTRADPTNASWQRDFALSLEWIGRVTAMRDNDADALKSFQAALVIRQRLAGTTPRISGGKANWPCPWARPVMHC